MLYVTIVKSCHALPNMGSGDVTNVAFSPDGKMLASGSDNQTITLWDVASGKELLTLSGQTSSGFYSVAFSPDGKTLASGSGDSKVKLWDVITGEILFEFTHTPW